MKVGGVVKLKGRWVERYSWREDGWSGTAEEKVGGAIQLKGRWIERYSEMKGWGERYS